MTVGRVEFYTCRLFTSAYGIACFADKTSRQAAQADTTRIGITDRTRTKPYGRMAHGTTQQSTLRFTSETIRLRNRRQRNGEREQWYTRHGETTTDQL
jgi:hypothetical protein